MGSKHQISGAFWFLISLVVIQQSLSLGVGTFLVPGAGAFPFFCGVILFILSVMIFFRTLVRAREGDNGAQFVIDWYAFRRLGTMIGVFLAYIFIFPYLGFFFTTFWLMFFLFRNPEQRGWWVPPFAAALTIIASYFLFKILLMIDFPKGPWILR